MLKNKIGVFKRLLDSDLMKDEGNRAMLALLFTDESIGRDGVIARKEINIISPTVDIAFTHPLVFWDYLFHTGLYDIINCVEDARDISDLHKRLNTMGRTLLYADTFAILDFYRHPIDMIPDVNQKIIKKGFNSLYNHIKPIVKVFTPSKQIPTTLSYNLPEKSLFKSNKTNKMVWYLCATDLSWTCALFEGAKSKVFPNTPSLLHLPFILAEKNTQTFFDIYSTGVEALIKDNLTVEQLIILNMIFSIDDECYNDWVKYHKMINVLPDEFFDEMNVFCQNVSSVKKTIEIKVK